MTKIQVNRVHFWYLFDLVVSLGVPPWPVVDFVAVAGKVVVVVSDDLENYVSISCTRLEH